MTNQTYFEPLIHFPQWLKDEMRRQGMTITRLSQLSGVSSNSIAGYLKDSHEPSLFAACCICDALGFSLGVRQKK